MFLHVLAFVEAVWIIFHANLIFLPSQAGMSSFNQRGLGTMLKIKNDLQTLLFFKERDVYFPLVNSKRSASMNMQRPLYLVTEVHEKV